MLEGLLADHLWLALMLWAASYVSDFAFTLHTARLYHAHAREHFVYSGSFELTPYYQADVDRLRAFGPRFWLALAVSLAGMGLVWVLSVVVLGLPSFFTFLVGALLLRQAAVHLRHARNLVLFRAVRAGGAVTGQVSYARHVVLRLSAAEFATAALLYAGLGVVTSSVFVAGGAVACAATSWQHWRLAQAARGQPNPRA